MLIADDGVRYDRGRLSDAVIWTRSEPMPGRLGGTDPDRVEWRDEHFDPAPHQTEPYDPDARWPIMRHGRPDWGATMRGLRAAIGRETAAQDQRIAAAQKVA